MTESTDHHTKIKVEKLVEANRAWFLRICLLPDNSGCSFVQMFPERNKRCFDGTLTPISTFEESCLITLFGWVNLSPANMIKKTGTTVVGTNKKKWLMGI
ncbi:hypothetical protein H5410_055836 [Solanum commersonii]|uniref:Uncharacterized protein n=1 Tax=Solanum commersonii TaxID=4109 RepID=A0A9J5WLE5_SOLCO|nr:hypothetical protein H5410_055836 [Solanum commersonii]